MAGFSLFDCFSSLNSLERELSFRPRVGLVFAAVVFVWLGSVFVADPVLGQELQPRPSAVTINITSLSLAFILISEFAVAAAIGVVLLAVETASAMAM